MHFENSIGKLGVDFSSYDEYEKIKQDVTYKTTFDRLKQYPSDICKSCEYLYVCYGGCPVVWKNYSFDIMKKCKDEYYKNK